ncbi:hypothetical protein RI367_002232 [Sorochytrium milnesiophthora]
MLSASSSSRALAAAAAMARRGVRSINTLGIRRETKLKWERRVPLLPEHVERLVSDGVKVIVQPSKNRIVGDERFKKAGATVSEDLSPADVILGIKEVSLAGLLPDKTYMFFSHTHKGQKYNMPMLKDILDKRIRLLDYELVKDENERRLVLFGTFAGYAGMIDGLHCLGHRMLALGYGSPFLNVGMAHTYPTLEHAKSTLRDLGSIIEADGTPADFGPLTVVFTGSGNVSQGAQEVFKCLPHEFVKPQDLKKLVQSKDYDRRKVYATVVDVKDHVAHNEGKPFDMQDYIKHPHNYHSNFHRDIAPYATMLVTGNYWDKPFPRLLTVQQAKDLAPVWERTRRMITIADISCDVRGSLEFMSHATKIDDPWFMHDPLTGKDHKNIDGAGVQIMSVDILPSELPLEASKFFGDSLFPHIKDLLKDKIESPILKGALIAEKGELKEKHAWLKKHLPETSYTTKSKRVVVLGSGFVAGPLVDYLLRDPDVVITLATNVASEATALAAARDSDVQARITVEEVDVSGSTANDHLKGVLNSADVVVSLIPATLHPVIAKACIELKKNMVTASYISPALAGLNESAKQSGITIMNEVGLDPGIDHLTAKNFIDEVQENGGKIKGFVSWCGGLPAPENSDNPLGYKFSWSPKGVLLAAMNLARYKWHGKEYNIPPEQLLLNVRDVPMFKGFAFEGLANRDSYTYLDMYNLGPIEQMDTMFRGTLRYKGYAEMVYMFRQLGLMSLDRIDASKVNEQLSWPEYLRLASGLSQPLSPAVIAKRLGLAESDPKLKSLMSALDWLGVLSNHNNIALPAHMHEIAHIDIFCRLLQEKLVYNPGERDMVAMHHVFDIETRAGKQSTHTATMVAYGDPIPHGYTGMAKTVGLPAAIAAEMLLNGDIAEKGVLAPMAKSVYQPMLIKLENEGVRFVEKEEL